MAICFSCENNLTTETEKDGDGLTADVIEGDDDRIEDLTDKQIGLKKQIILLIWQKLYFLLERYGRKPKDISASSRIKIMHSKPMM